MLTIMENKAVLRNVLKNVSEIETDYNRIIFSKHPIKSGWYFRWA